MQVELKKNGVYNKSLELIVFFILFRERNVWNFRKRNLKSTYYRKYWTSLGRTRQDDCN